MDSMDNKTNICVVVVSKDNELSAIESSVDNLKLCGCTTNEFIVAIKNENNEEIIEYCNNNEIRYYEYKSEVEIYYELPKTIEFNYISFINSGDKYRINFKTKLQARINSNYKNIYVIPIKYRKKVYSLSKLILKLKEIDIEKSPDKVWIHLKSAFINKNLINKIEKPRESNLKYYLEINLITKLISLNGSYYSLRGTHLSTSEKLEDSVEAKLFSYDISWYKNIFNNIKDIEDYSEENHKYILKYIQYTNMYLIKNIINENVNSRNKHILVKDKLDEFYKNTRKVLQKIDDEIIMKTLGNKLVNFYLLRLKYDLVDKEIGYREFETKIHVLNNNNIRIFSASETKIRILLMDYIDENLIITATYPLPFNENKLKIYAEYLDNKIYVEKNDLFSEYKAFGEKLYENYVFTVKIPLKANNEKEYIKFFLEGEKTTIDLDINFNKPLSKLSKSRYAYWNCGKFTLNYRKKAILVMNNTKLRHLKREYMYLLSLLRSKNKNARKAGKIRILYHLTKPFYKKEIWLFEDKVYKAGDNGEYLYTYSSKQKDGIKKYYILKKGCIDTKRFKKEKKKYVTFGTLRHKLLFLNSNLVFETHNNVTKQHSFDEKIEKYFRDLYNSDNACIQHGLTVQYIPHLTNRINDNLKYFFVASPIEEKNLKNKEYAYKGYEDAIKVTGCPRYDGLKNNDMKQILITPTWRSYLALPSLKYGDTRRYNDNFKNSEYFKIYNNLINDERLISTAKKYGYKIIYLLHPCTSSQIEDFETNDSVELIAAADDLNYEKILTESSLMLTDYSGVQFDFAYMYKPIIYFHPDELPPSYEEGEYKYETMSLGDITRNNEETVDLLCEYMENDCKIKEKYKERIDQFFKYHDNNNCKRIYDEIMKSRKDNK